MDVSYRKPGSRPGSAPIFIGGSTCSASSRKYAFERELGEWSMLPRLNAQSKPGTPGHAFMTSPPTIRMAEDAARITMRWAEATNPELAATLRHAKEVIPPELRYGDTFWTAITLVGDLRDGNNHIHKDLHDVVSLIVMVGKDITGGATHYYDDTGKVVQTVPFEHGRYQVCEFDKVWHASEQWQGKRGIISFYLNREIMEHFARYGTAKYEAARERMYM